MFLVLCSLCGDTATKYNGDEEYMGTNKLVVTDLHYRGGSQISAKRRKST